MEGDKMTRKYSLSLIFFPQDTGGYHVECPEIPGCFSCGDTIEECEENMRELIPEFMPDEIKTELQEDMFRLGHCLPGKVFREFDAEITDTGEVVFPSAKAASVA
jgi:predicted RNase H-like HicB family nuclease